MEEQLAPPHRLGILAATVLVGTDVDVLEPRLGADDTHETVAEVDLAGPNRLDLGARQDDAGVERLVDEVVVVGAPVRCHRALVRCLGWDAHGKMLPTEEKSAYDRRRRATRLPTPLLGGNVGADRRSIALPPQVPALRRREGCAA